MMGWVLIGFGIAGGLLAWRLCRHELFREVISRRKQARERRRELRQFDDWCEQGKTRASGHSSRV